jgi:dipeptidyl aminopeptidase/acylaminoacyl peptidase
LIPQTGKIVFTDAKSGAVCLLDPEKCEVEEIVKQKDVRFADFSASESQPRYVLAISEEGAEVNPQTTIDRLVVIDLENKKVGVLREGADFYTTPRFSPDGTKVCWIEWNHPEVTWRASKLRIASWTENGLENIADVAGAKKRQSIAQPRWGFDRVLFFASDVSGYYQLYAYNVFSDGGEVRKLHLHGYEEYEFAGPEFLIGR